MPQKVSRELPLAEITLRKYERAQKPGKRESVRKACLSLGLLQPGDSRDVIVDVLYVLMSSRRRPLGIPEIERRVIALRKEHTLPPLGIAGSNIRRQVKRLRDMMIAEKSPGGYRISERMGLAEIFRDKIERYLLPSILERVREHLEHADSLFSRRKYRR